jgi:uncharacterized membrane protein
LDGKSQRLRKLHWSFIALSNLVIGKLLKVELLVQLAAFFAILLNIPFLRQAIVFIYLTFLPGFLILRFLKPDEFTTIEIILFSSGLSIAFSMFLCLFLNEVYPAIGVLRPLSAFPLLLSTCAIITVLYLVTNRQNDYSLRSTAANLKFHASVPLLVSIPFIAILGAVLAATLGNNSVLLVLVVLISSVVLSIFSKKLIPQAFYPLAILSISASLLLQGSLISQYIIGYDVHLEYFFARLTFTNAIWNSAISNSYNGMLSVTLLPTVFANFLNVDLNWIYKVVFPLIFSLVPLTLYQAYRKLTDSRTAFLGAFLFMSTEMFYSTMLGLPRQMIGELFLALLILLIVADNISLAKRKILFLIFGAGLIVSHYALSYIFMFYIIFTFCLFSVMKKNHFKERALISGTLVILYSAMTLFWYIFVSPTILDTLVRTFDFIYKQIFEFSQAGPGVAGLLPTYLSPLHEISRYLFYILELLIIIGIAKLLIKYKDSKFNPEYLMMSLASISVLLACIFVPSFAGSLQVSRWIQISLLFLAPFSVLGCKAVLKLFARIILRLPTSPKRFAAMVRRGWLPLMSILLVSSFLFQVGFVYEITNDVPTSISLGIGRKDKWAPYMISSYTPEQDVFSATWLGVRIANDSGGVYGDSSIYHVLTSYALISITDLFLLSNSTEIEHQGEYVYLSSYNVIRGSLDGTYGLSNTTQIKPILDNMDKIYSNGASEVYYSAKLKESP